MTRILIVEDDPGVRSFLDDVLSDEGYCVETAADGRVAMEMVDRALPDLLITDLLLPGLTGWSVLARVRRQAPNLPILIISGAMTRNAARIPTPTGSSRFAVATSRS